MTNLEKFTKYSISIGVFNRAGQGPKVQLYSKTLIDLPGPVGDLRFNDVTLDSLNLSWNQPLEPNGPLIGYVVIYRTYKMAGGKQNMILSIHFRF